MKYFQFLFFVFFLFTSHFIKAQNKTSLEKEITELHKTTKKINDSIIILKKEIDLKIKMESDSIKCNQLNLQLDLLYDAQDQNEINGLKLDFNFARQHPNSYEALQLMRVSVNRFIGMNFYDTFVEVFQNFTPEIKNSDKGKEMAESLAYFKQSKVGSIAPNFSLEDSNGKIISLDDFKEKQYILIDFWASWCAPCREELPYIKELYKKYHQQGFEIISIAKDDKTDSWKNAIAKEKIESWKHIFTDENTRKIIKDYYVYGIPHKILIDKNGVIIGKWKGSGENNKHDLQRLLKSIFEAE